MKRTTKAKLTAHHGLDGGLRAVDGHVCLPANPLLDKPLLERSSSAPIAIILFARAPHPWMERSPSA